MMREMTLKTKTMTEMYGELLERTLRKTDSQEQKNQIAKMIVRNMVNIIAERQREKNQTVGRCVRCGIGKNIGRCIECERIDI